MQTHGMESKCLKAVRYQQDDLITRAQALAVGVTKEAIRHAIGERGGWQVVLPGIYATFTGPAQSLHRHRAAVLYGGTDAVITGGAACRLYRLRYVVDDGHIDVLVPKWRQRRDTGFVRLHRTVRLPQPRLWLGTDDPSGDDVDKLIRAEHEDHDPVAAGARRWQLPLAPPARAAMDEVRFRYLATNRAFHGRVPIRDRWRLIQDARALLCEVVQRRWAVVADLLVELDAVSRGTAIARLAMDDLVAGCRSAPECELRDLIRTSKILPEPRWNRPLPGHKPDRRQDELTPDACLREARLVVEVDSVEWHRIGPRQEQTEKRRARYAELGWLVISVSPHRIRNEPNAVLRDIERTYLSQLRKARE